MLVSKLAMPEMYSQFFRVISQISEYVKMFCNGRINPFHFACRRWIKNQYFEKNVKLMILLKAIWY